LAGQSLPGVARVLHRIDAIGAVGRIFEVDEIDRVTGSVANLIERPGAYSRLTQRFDARIRGIAVFVEQAILALDEEIRGSVARDAVRRDTRERLELRLVDRASIAVGAGHEAQLVAIQAKAVGVVVANVADLSVRRIDHRAARNRRESANAPASTEQG